MPPSLFLNFRVGLVYHGKVLRVAGERWKVKGDLLVTVLWKQNWRWEPETLPTSLPLPCSLVSSRRVQNHTSWLFPSVKCDTLPVPQQPPFGRRASELVAMVLLTWGRWLVLTWGRRSSWQELRGACPQV